PNTIPNVPNASNPVRAACVSLLVSSRMVLASLVPGSACFGDGGRAFGVGDRGNEHDGGDTRDDEARRFWAGDDHVVGVDVRESDDGWEDQQRDKVHDL